jgi:acyl-CoA thioesterase II
MASIVDPVVGTSDTGLPELLTLERIEDGMFRMAASFHRAEDGPVYQARPAPDVEPPEDLPDSERRGLMHAVRLRIPTQPQPSQRWPSRVWIRSRHRLDGNIEHACALAYVSDMFTGHSAVPGMVIGGPLTSIDHSLWLYRTVALDDWVLMDLQPEVSYGGRATYTGRIFSRDGMLCAGIAQETLFRWPTAHIAPPGKDPAAAARTDGLTRTEGLVLPDSDPPGRSADQG